MPVRKWWASMLAVIVVAFLIANSQVDGQYRICNVPCCSFWPNCQNAEQVDCNCGRQGTIELQANDLPATTEFIRIRNVNRVAIKENAIRELFGLQSFLIEHISSLEVYRNGLARHEKTQLHEVTITAVNKTNIHGGSISGEWKSGTNIKFAHIGVLTLLPEAINHSSSSRGPNLFVNDIEFLNVYPGWQAATISHLSMANITIDKCKKHTLTSRAFNVDLKYIKINELQEECLSFNGINGDCLSIHSIKFINVMSNSVIGSVKSLEIKYSYFNHVSKNGFKLNVTTMRISNSRFHILNEHSINASARQSIILEDIRINVLKNRSLYGLQMSTREEGSLEINRLKVNEALNGSLKFQANQNVWINSIDIDLPPTHVCPTSKWVRQLVGKHMKDPLTRPEMRVYRTLRRTNTCHQDGWITHPAVSRGSQKDDGKEDGKTKTQKTHIDTNDDFSQHETSANNKLTSTSVPEVPKTTASHPALDKAGVSMEDQNAGVSQFTSPTPTCSVQPLEAFQDIGQNGMTGDASVIPTEGNDVRMPNGHDERNANEGLEQRGKPRSKIENYSNSAGETEWSNPVNSAPDIPDGNIGRDITDGEDTSFSVNASELVLGIVIAFNIGLMAYLLYSRKSFLKCCQRNLSNWMSNERQQGNSASRSRMSLPPTPPGNSETESLSSIHTYEEIEDHDDHD